MEMKSGDFAKAWGGVAGVQSTLSVLLDRGYHYSDQSLEGRQLPLDRISSLIATEPARRFRIPGKGSIAVGMDADLTLVDLSRSSQLRPEHLMQRHPMSNPYLGFTFRGNVERTIRRGETIFASGKITARGPGKFVRPVR